ncbi:hypothetical protein L195_g059880, partial [Trifolium pratense]
MTFQGKTTDKKHEEGATEAVAEWGPTLRADTRRNVGGRSNTGGLGMTVRDNQLITTQVQTLPPSPPTARLRQMLMGPDTRSTRIPKYKDTTTQEKLAIVPHGSAD